MALLYKVGRVVDIRGTLRRRSPTVRLSSRGRSPFWIAAALSGIIGGILAVVLFGSVERNIGPLEATFSIRPATDGRTEVDLAPLGSLRLDTHSGPIRLRIDIDRLQLANAQTLLGDQAALDALPEQVEQQSKAALRALAVRCLLVGFAGGAVVALLRRPTWRSGVTGGVAASVLLASTFTYATSTVNVRALQEPRYTGLLTLAPQAVGDVRNVTEKFALYREQLNSLVENVSRLYQITEATNGSPTDASTLRILHISDLHLNPAGFDLTRQMVNQFKPAAVIDTGDINDWGTTFEANYVDRIGTLGVPYLYVKGNHDSAETAAAVAAQKNAIVLNGDSVEIEGLRIWGIGDSRFTADKTLYENNEAERREADAFAETTRSKFLGSTPPADVALVHDPRTATGLASLAPLILAGHLHSSETRRSGSSTMLIEGSTGGAGLRGIEAGGSAVPLECSMLYFDRTTHRLVAYDRVTVSGIGGSGVQIRRHVVEDDIDLPKER